MKIHYVYGIGTKSEAERLRAAGSDAEAVEAELSRPVPPGLDGQESIEWLALDDRLAVWFSSVEQEWLTGGRLEEAGAAAEAALSHHSIVEWLHTGCAFVPFAFGVAFAGPAELRKELGKDAARWQDLLELVAGAEELEVRLDFDVERLREDMMRERLGGVAPQGLSAGKRYLMERSVERDLPAREQECVERAWLGWDERLNQAWRQGRLPGLRAQEMRANGARVYLHEISSQDLALLADLENESKAGIRFQVSGGWPVYSFTAAANVEQGPKYGERDGELEARLEGIVPVGEIEMAGSLRLDP